MAETIAALYVAAEGAYANLLGVDVWDETRDARTYAGPWSVVAHPPCQRWGRLGFAAWRRWGGEHNQPGADDGCFTAALASVRRWGGVLEHPAYSYAWLAHGLPWPPEVGGWQRDTSGGWCCRVDQGNYGHAARKSTWLYVVGGDLPELRWTHAVGSHQVGFFDRRGKDRNKPTLRRADANATPPAFRDLLISIASGVAK